MASTGNSSKDPKSGNYLSDQLMDLLDLAVAQKQSNMFKTTVPDSEHTTLVALSNVQGFSEAVQFIYNNLPKEAQHGWNTRRTNRRPQGSLTSGPEGSGGGREPEGSRSDKKRRSPLSRTKRLWKSS